MFEHLDSARADVLACNAIPKDVWQQVWTSSRNERLNNELRRLNGVAVIFLNCDAIIRLIGATLAEQSNECAE